ncbi:hypothetical protein Misp05_44810 [Micromonospora sp. NBRC 107095]|nr:hypothetical protein Misp05_44810 [Micromonospora sp. NBRC 107095]
MQLCDMKAFQLTFVVAVVQPFAFVVLIVLARPNPESEYLARALAGTAVMGIWSNVVWSSGNLLRQERLEGTLAAVLVRPASLVAVVLGRSLAVAVASTCIIGLTLLLASALLGMELAVSPSPALALVLLLTIGSATALGVLLASIMLASRSGQRILGTLMYPVFALGGLVIPPESLPPFARWLADLISLHYVTVMASDLASNRPVQNEAVLWVLLLSAGYLAAGVLALHRSVHHGKAGGSLEFV